MGRRGGRDRSRDRSAGHRISRLLITAVSVTMLLMAASVSALLIQHARIHTLTAQIQPALQANRTLFQVITDAESDVRSYSFQPTEQLRRSYRSHVTKVDGLTAELDRLAVGTELPGQLSRQRALISTWLTSSGAVLADGGSRARAESDFGAVRSINTAITQQLTHRSTDLSKSSDLITAIVVVGIILLSLGEVVVLLLRGLRARQAIGPPLESLHGVVAARRRGDLSARADPGRGALEIRAVAAEVNDLIEAEERRRETLLQDLRLANAVREIGLKIGGSLELETVLGGSAEAITRHFRADSAWIRTFDPDDHLLGIGMRAAYPPAAYASIDLSEELADHSTEAARAAWAQQTAIILGRADLEGPHEYEEAYRRDILRTLEPLGTESILIGAIGSGQECLGVLALGRLAGRPAWTGSEVGALVRAGQEIGQAVMHARLFKREENLLGQARSLEELKGDFVATVSHELRTPLTSIVGNVELIRSGDVGEVSPMIGKCVASIERNSQRLTLLVEDLLLLSQVEQRPVAFSPLPVGAVVADALAAQRESAGRRGITLVDRVPPAVTAARVVGNELELERVLNNVIGNAIKFSPAGSQVTIDGRLDRDLVSVSVTDQGIGISPEDQRNLFTKFFRSTNPAAHKISGTGLGLTICKHIVEQHAGTIRVSSALGAGTTMTVTLPLLGTARQPRPTQLADLDDEVGLRA